MAALTANLHKKERFKGITGSSPVQYTYRVADGVTIYEGALIGLTADGYATPITTTDFYGFLGVSIEDVDNSSGSNGDETVTVTTPPFLSGGLLDDLTMADEDIGMAVYCATDNPADITLVPTATSTRLGVLDRLEGGVALKYMVRCEYATRASGAVIATLTGTTVLVLKDAASAGQLRLPHDGRQCAATLDPGGAGRTVTLPAVTQALANCQHIYIANSADAAEDLTVKDPSANTIVTISQNQIGHCWTDGTTWYGGIMPQT